MYNLIYNINQNDWKIQSCLIMLADRSNWWYLPPAVFGQELMEQPRNIAENVDGYNVHVESQVVDTQ